MMIFRTSFVHPHSKSAPWPWASLNRSKGWVANGLLMVACLVMLAGCAPEKSGPVAPEADSESVAQEADTNWLANEFKPAQNLVVIAVDGLRLGAWPGDEYPNLAALVRDGRAFENHTAGSLASHAQMASLLSGQSPRRHGVGSVRERGRSFIGTDLPWWPAFMQEQGWNTLATVATPQFGAHVGGMQRGFDTFVEPDIQTTVYQPSERVRVAARDAWLAMLADPAAFLLVQHFSDFKNPGLWPTPNVMAKAKAALEGWVAKYPNLGEAVSKVDASPAGFTEVRQALGRQRGSAVFHSFSEAVYAGQLADLDEALGSVMADLKAGQCFETTVVALVSLRGSILGPPSTEGAAFRPEIVRCPLVLWAPGRVRPGMDDSLLTTDEVGRRLMLLMGVAATSGDEAIGAQVPAVEVWDASLARRATYGRRLHSEPNAVSGTMRFNRTGAPLMSPASLGAVEQAEWKLLDEFAAQGASEWGYRVAFELPSEAQVTVRWRAIDGHLRGARGSSEHAVQMGRTTPVHGQATLRGSGTLYLDTYVREQELLLHWEGAPQDPGPSATPRLWVVRRPRAADADPDLEGARPVRFVRDSGIWTRVMVQAQDQGNFEILAGQVPSPKDSSRKPDAIECTVDARVDWDRIPGREAALSLRGAAPLNAQVKEPPPFGLVAAVKLGSSWLPPGAIGLENTHLFAPGSASLYVPDWWPNVTESLEQAGGWELFPGMRLERIPSVAGERKALGDPALQYIKHMGRGE